MLWQSNVPQIFAKMGIDAFNQANTARKKETAKRLDFFHDGQLAYLEAMLAEMYAEPDRLQKVHLNLVRKVICNLAQTYRIPPVREIDGEGREVFNAMCQAASLDLKLKQASRYAKLLKTLLIKVVWRNGHIDLDILTGNIVDVETGDSPEDLQAVLITDYGQSEKPEDIEYSLWRPDTWQRLDHQGNIIDSAENIYHTLPFIPIFDYPPTTSGFWLPGGDDLIQQQEAVNVKIVDLLHLLRWQSFGVGYLKGHDERKDGSITHIGPGMLVELPEDGEIGFKSQQAEINAVVAAIDKIIKWTAMAQGLSAGTVSTDTSESSGVSKVWDSVELSEMRTEDKMLWQAYEQKLFNLMRVVHNTHAAKKLPESATLKVNFADPAKPVLSPLDQAQAYTNYFDMGVMSPVDILMEKDRDIRSREEALERLKTIKDEIKTLTPASQGVKLER